MAHFAELDENNIVLRVIVIDNEVITQDNIESEQLGVDFCKSLFGNNTNWRQTSYNESFRYNYAGCGFKYDEVNNAFIPPKPYNSWLLDNNTYKWIAPINYPNDGKLYNWDEENICWVLNPNYN